MRSQLSIYSSQWLIGFARKRIALCLVKSCLGQDGTAVSCGPLVASALAGLLARESFIGAGSKRSSGLRVPPVFRKSRVWYGRAKNGLKHRIGDLVSLAVGKSGKVLYRDTARWGGRAVLLQQGGLIRLQYHFARMRGSVERSGRHIHFLLDPSCAPLGDVSRAGEPLADLIRVALDGSGQLGSYPAEHAIAEGLQGRSSNVGNVALSHSRTISRLCFM